MTIGDAVREGARVIATDLNEALLTTLQTETGCTTQRLDVTDAAAISAAAAQHGPVNVLFNAAGYVHAGTVLDADGQVRTSGGRVLCVTVLADSVKQAQQKVYDVARGIHFDGAQYRRDIGFRAVKN